MDATLNDPAVVAEVTRLFERYEQALIDKDVAVLDDTFWNSSHTIRYAPAENGYGFDAIHDARLRAPKLPGGTKARRVRLEVLTIGQDVATVNLEYEPRGRAGIGRQSQFWVRFPDQGWKIVSAHVSVIEAP